jgi:alpha-tubulin suppressor-like RCC1 family protein
MGGARLGLGDTASRNLPTLVDSGTWSPSLSAGNDHTCAIKTNGDAYCWGDNQYGQLSTGDTTDRDEPDNIGGVQGSTDWTAITAGGWHTCGIRDNGQLYCWGRNRNSAGVYGILGTGYNTSPIRTVPTDVFASDVSIDWRDVDAGTFHTCAVTDSDWLYCWGDTQYGQAAQPPDCSLCEPVVTSPTGPFMFSVDELDVGGYHSCAIEDDDDLWCWGRNNQGQLGLGDRNYGSERDFPEQVV